MATKEGDEVIEQLRGIMAFVSVTDCGLERMGDELDRLRAREDEARRIINAAFGEYACMILALLTEDQKATFERNFAVDARKWLHAVSPTSN